VWDLLGPVGLWAAILLAFWRIGPAGRVLAEGDLFTYFFPYWSEATRALASGRLPLWNPVLFMGVPFLANSQVGLFYPLNWPLWLLLPAHRSLHWSIILHLGLAATGTYLYGRSSLRLRPWGAWAASIALALGGYLGAQVEHINQLQALAWLPWLLLVFDWAAGRSMAPASTMTGTVARTGALAALVTLVLLAGHTQSAFIVMLGLVIYGLVPWGGAPGDARRAPLARRSAVLLMAGVLGAALAAVQLVPTFELTQHSVRAGGLPFNERVSFSLSPVYLARALLPGYDRPVEPENIEYVATVGVVGLGLAVLGAAQAVARRKEGAGLPFRVLLLAAVGLLLALGLYNPLYLLLARFVPGFAHFRVPARWLALWAFGAAMLLGVGVDRLARRDLPCGRRAATGAAGLALLLTWGAVGGHAGLPTVVGWVTACVLAGLLAWVCRAAWGRPRLAALGAVALVTAELALSARTLPHARATAAGAYTSLRPAAAHLVAAAEEGQPPGRFLSLSALGFDPGDLPELRLIYGHQLSPDALYALVVATKQREVLSPNLPLVFGVPAVDGFGGGLLPLSRYLTLQHAFLPADVVSLDGRLRENLAGVPDGRWLSLLDARYVITDKVFDAWIDGVFYDLQFGASLEAGEAADVAYVPPFDATAVGLVSYLEGAAEVPDGTPVGEVTVGFAAGTSRTFSLRAGVETAQGLYGAEVAHAQAAIGGHFWPGQPEGVDYVARLRWEEAASPTSVAIRSTLPQGRLVVRGLSLIDERTDSFQSLVFSDRGRFRLVHSGDVKVYENLEVMGRAFVVHRASTAPDDAAALTRMRAADFDPSREVVLEGGAALEIDAQGADQVRILSYAPERVTVTLDLAAPGYLILTDANYPGWRAWVDGEPVEVLTADLLFRAVRVGAGTHQVTLTFEPRSVRVGALLSLLASVALIGLWLTARLCDVKNRRRHEG
jgi:hypothetical protein